jgi:hypothetical protein
MCAGGGAQAPNYVSLGPEFNERRFREQNQQLEITRRQMEGATQRLQSQLDQQIAAANADAERVRASLAEQTAAMAAEAAARQTGPYATTTTAAAPTPGYALTTDPTKRKKAPAAGLTIAPSSASAAAGAGLNIGT